MYYFSNAPKKGKGLPSAEPKILHRSRPSLGSNISFLALHYVNEWALVQRQLDSLSVRFTIKLPLLVQTLQQSWLRCAVQSSALRVQRLPQVEVQKHYNQNHKYHSPLKHVRVQLVILDLFVSVGVTQTLCLVVHNLIYLLIQFLVVDVIAPHGDAPHEQPKAPAKPPQTDVHLMKVWVVAVLIIPIHKCLRWSNPNFNISPIPYTLCYTMIAGEEC